MTEAIRERRLFVGRSRERNALDRLLADVRNGRSRTLVLRGDPGVGKTALLEYAAESASGLRVAGALGAGSDVELPFAALHQLCTPMLGGLELLIERHRDALSSAFGLTAGDSPEPFLVGVAALNLLAEEALRQPVLCVIDDAQWIDEASACALEFVARRLLAEPVGMLFATRHESWARDLGRRAGRSPTALSVCDQTSHLPAMVGTTTATCFGHHQQRHHARHTGAEVKPSLGPRVAADLPFAKSREAETSRWDPAGASIRTTQAVRRRSPASSASVESPPTSRPGSDRDRITRPKFPALTIELGTPRSSDRAMRQWSRAIAFPGSDHRTSDRGVIAFDGKQSSRADPAGDRFPRPAAARRAIAPCRSGWTSWSRSRARYAEQPTGCEALHRCAVRSHSETEHLR